jgi:thiamine-monophosphate kinase
MPSEFELIRRFFTYRAPGAVLGVGDDAALVRARPGMEIAVSTDMLVAGRHFLTDTDPVLLGHKALAVNLSDMAAMGATPRWVTLSLALPRAEAGWLAGFARGFMRLARKHAVDLIGGDTTRGPLNICVQIMGEVPAGQALRRDGARDADDVWVSGTLGDAALAVAASKGHVRLDPQTWARIARRLDQPTARVALGIALRRIANSAIDVSDGLIADLGHICERSRLAAQVELERLPLSAVMRRVPDRAARRSALLAGGDDYELCFTAPGTRARDVERAARSAGVRVTRIGRMLARKRGGALVTVLHRGQPLRIVRGGYEHFR